MQASLLSRKAANPVQAARGAASPLPVICAPQLRCPHLLSTPDACVVLPVARNSRRSSALRSKLVLVQAQGEESSQQSAPVSEHPFPEEADFDTLSGRITELTKDLNDELCGCSIYLVGMMGSGKSTLGKMLANTLKYALFDTDMMVEKAHDDKPVSAIFKEYGEDYFRNCEAEVLKQLAPYKNLVVATGGGAVIRPMNWSYLHSGVVVWLNGPTDLLAKRVAKEGVEKRPLLASPENPNPSQEEMFSNAKSKLDSILAERARFYDNADLKISLEGYCEDAERGAPTVVVMYRLLNALRQRIRDTKAEREARKDFVVQNQGLPTTNINEVRQPGQEGQQEQ